jgi:hypothetical protein
MAIIVKHKDTKERYVLLGSGYGLYKSEVSSPIFGDLAPIQSKGSQAKVCVSNAKGEVGWLDSTEVIVDSVDGEAVESILSSTPSKSYTPPIKPDQELMSEYGIALVGGKYIFGKYKYDSLSDAVSYAKSQAR